MPNVTHHELWFDISEVTTASLFGGVSKLKKVEGENRPAVRNKLYLLS
jgi:hypothetical protein